MIIGISGKLQSGKDTIASIIQYLTSKEFSKMSYSSFCLLKERWYNYDNWQIKKFASKLKEIISILTEIPIEDLEKQEVKNRALGEEWNRTFYKIIDSDNTVLLQTFYKEDAELNLAYYEDYHYRTVELIEFKDTPINVRQLLQEIGTDAMRDIIHPNIWVNALMCEYKMSGGFGYTHDNNKETSIIKTSSYPNWIITDVRFPNELKAVKDKKGITIRVNRYTGHVGIDNDTHVVTDWQHPSETALDRAKFDYIIDNDNKIEDLINQVKEILIKEKIIK